MDDDEFEEFVREMVAEGWDEDILRRLAYGAGVSNRGAFVSDVRQMRGVAALLKLPKGAVSQVLRAGYTKLADARVALGALAGVGGASLSMMSKLIYAAATPEELASRRAAKTASRAPAEAFKFLREVSEPAAPEQSTARRAALRKATPRAPAAKGTLADVADLAYGRM